MSSSGYLKKRREVIYHYKKMTFAEIAVFDVLTMEANYRKEPKHVAEMSLRKLAMTFDCSVNTMRSALAGLKEMNFIERYDTGWRIINPDGDSPVNHPPRKKPKRQDRSSRPVSVSDTPLCQSVTHPVSISDTPLCQSVTHPVSVSDTPTTPNHKKTKEIPAPKKEVKEGSERREGGSNPKKTSPKVWWNNDEKTIEANDAFKLELSNLYLQDFGNKEAMNRCLEKMNRWLRANPDRHPKEKWSRFVKNWFRKEIDIREERQRNH